MSRPVEAGDLPVTVTLWPSLYNTKGRRVTMTWAEWLAELTSPRRIKSLEQKESLPGWSAATFANDRRAKADCESLSALVLDYDGTQPLEAAKAWAPYFGCIYTSVSHGDKATQAKKGTPYDDRFRVVMPYTRTVSAVEHADLLRWAHTILGGIDDATKDPSRLWFVTARVNAFQYIPLDGRVIDPDAVLRANKIRSQSPMRARYSRSDEWRERSRGNYSLSALERAAETIRTTPEGSRGKTINKEAYGIAGLVAGGSLDEQSSFATLATAAEMSGDPAWRKALLSGWNAGLRKPREMRLRVA
jgi:hypothetical protein